MKELERTELMDLVKEVEYQQLHMDVFAITVAHVVLKSGFKLTSVSHCPQEVVYDLLKERSSALDNALQQLQRFEEYHHKAQEVSK